MRKINVLFLPHPVPALATPWSDDVVQAIDIHHQLARTVTVPPNEKAHLIISVITVVSRHRWIV